MPTGDVGGPSSCLSGKVFLMRFQFHTRHGHEILKGRQAILSADASSRTCWDSARAGLDGPLCGCRLRVVTEHLALLGSATHYSRSRSALTGLYAGILW